MEFIDQYSRVPIDEENPSIVRIEDKCIRCGECARVCREYMSVLDHYDLRNTNKAVCVNCGQCANVCPTNSIVERLDYRELQTAMADKSKIFIVSTAPAVRVALGEEFGLPYGSFVQGKMVQLCARHQLWRRLDYYGRVERTFVAFTLESGRANVYELLSVLGEVR